MKFAYFTLGGKFFWEDIYNYQDWVIQRNLRTHKFRLLDTCNICRDYGTFEQCKDTLLKYIEAYELPPLHDDTVILLHGFGRTKSSLKGLVNYLHDIPANIIPLNYTSLRRGINYHANLLAQLIENLDIKGKLYIVNIGSGCLITRKLLHNSNNYRHYNIARILDINPLNSGSDLADLLSRADIFNFLLGPMLKDISTPQAMKVARIPEDIEHGIIFSPLTIHSRVKKLLSRFESIKFMTPPSEHSYAEKIKNLKDDTFFPLKNTELFAACKDFLLTGNFTENKEEN